MKIALVSPYDFAYPGGVLNHITNLEQQLTRMGHDVKIIAPASKAVPALGERFIPIGSPRPVPVSGSVARITLTYPAINNSRLVLFLITGEKKKQIMQRIIDDPETAGRIYPAARIQAKEKLICFWADE